MVLDYIFGIMKTNKSKDEVTVVAELTVISPLGSEIVRSFDKAWHHGLKLPRPVSVRLNGFVRKD